MILVLLLVPLVTIEGAWGLSGPFGVCWESIGYYGGFWSLFRVHYDSVGYPLRVHWGSGEVLFGIRSESCDGPSKFRCQAIQSKLEVRFGSMGVRLRSRWGSLKGSVWAQCSIHWGPLGSQYWVQWHVLRICGESDGDYLTFFGVPLRSIGSPYWALSGSARSHFGSGWAHLKVPYRFPSGP